jgi:DNA polymerase-4
MALIKENFDIKDNHYLFLDMNSFFASCEQQANKEWRNKPLIVAPYTGPTGCAIAVSKEAKKLGIKTGSLVKEALEICPNIIIAPAQYNLYHLTHKKIVNLMNNFSPWVEIKSVDELAMPLSPNERKGDRPILLAKEIKRAIRANLGSYLTCSIGISSNIFLAKQASMYVKPDGLTIINNENIIEILRNLKLKDLTGIGRKMGLRLESIGITTPLELYYSSPEFLRTHLGINGEYWYLRLHGLPIEYLRDKPATSISQSCVLSPQDRNRRRALIILQKLTHRAGIRLRQTNLSAQHIGLRVSFFHKRSIALNKKTLPFEDSSQFYKNIRKLWDQIPNIDQPYKIAIVAYDLKMSNYKQLDLFDQPVKTRQLYQAVDKINANLGDWSIYPASLIEVPDGALPRISFTKPR